MSIKIELTAEQRESFGKGNARRMRRLENRTPAIIYGGTKEPLAIQFPSHIIAHSLSNNESVYSSVLTIKLGKKSEKVILKAVQRHPANGNLLHLDFLRINEKKPLSIHVPLHFINEQDAPGVKEGDVPFYLLNEVEVTCLPADIPESIEIDVSHLEKGGVVSASDIKLPKGVELTSLTEDAPLMTLSGASPEVVEEAAPEEGEAEGEEGESEAGEENPEE